MLLRVARLPNPRRLLQTRGPPSWLLRLQLIPVLPNEKGTNDLGPTRHHQQSASMWYIGQNRHLMSKEDVKTHRSDSLRPGLSAALTLPVKQDVGSNSSWLERGALALLGVYKVAAVLEGGDLRPAAAGQLIMFGRTGFEEPRDGSAGFDI